MSNLGLDGKPSLMGYHILKQILSYRNLYWDDFEPSCGLQGASKQRLFLHEFVEQSMIYEAPYCPPAPNPENQRRLAQIRRQLEEEDYQSMVSNVDAAKKERETGGRSRDSVGDLHRHLGLGLSVLLTLISCFVFGFWVSFYCVSSLPMRVLTALFFSLIGVGADLYFHITRDLKD
eukprot:Sdes_comp20806_c0_seq1m17146